MREKILKSLSFILFLVVIFALRVKSKNNQKMKIEFGNFWNGDPYENAYEINFKQEAENLEILIDSKFFHDKRPVEDPGYLMGLWDYEVVEVFLLNKETEEYLELEFGPYGLVSIHMTHIKWPIVYGS